MTLGKALEISNANLVVRVVDTNSWVEKIAPEEAYKSLLDRDVVYITVDDHRLVLEVDKQDGDDWWEEAETV